MQTVAYIVLVPMVYLAFAVLVFGSLWQIKDILRRPAFKPTLKVYPEKGSPWLHSLADAFLFPTIRRHNPVLWGVVVLFHVCLFLLIIGHFELFREVGWMQVLPHEVFLGAGALGILVLLCLLFFLFRRFLPPVKELSLAEDYILLIVLILCVVFGVELHLAQRMFDYDLLGVSEYRDYMMSLLTFSPSIEAVTGAGHTVLLVLHIFFANLVIIFFPFSKMMHSLLVVPITLLRRK